MFVSRTAGSLRRHPDTSATPPQPHRPGWRWSPQGCGWHLAPSSPAGPEPAPSTLRAAPAASRSPPRGCRRPRSAPRGCRRPRLRRRCGAGVWDAPESWGWVCRRRCHHVGLLQRGGHEEGGAAAAPGGQRHARQGEARGRAAITAQGPRPAASPRGRPGRRRSPRGRAGAGAARSPPALLGGGRASARGLRCPGARAGPCGFLQLPLAPRVPRRGFAAPFMACRWGGAAPSTAPAGRAAPLGFATGCLGWAGKRRLRCQAYGVRRLGRSRGATGPCRTRGALSKPHAQDTGGDAAVESL